MKTKITLFSILALVLLSGFAQPASATDLIEPTILPLVVEKTAETSYHRDWQWKIRKYAYQKLSSLTNDQLTAINYQIKVGAIAKDKDWQVAGTITITNPEGNPAAEITSVTDVLSSSGPITAIDCGVTLPYSLPAGETLTCTYEQSLTSASSQTNTALVETTGAVSGASATAPVTFTTPTSETDHCVSVSDTNPQGPQGLEVCAHESIKTIKYHVTFGQNELANVPLACGDTRYSNTASFITNDTETRGESTVANSFHVECPTPTPFCSLSQGYWFAKPGTTWPDANGANVGEVTIGSSDYTQADGAEVWDSPNAGGIADLKKGFLQFAAIKLSQTMNLAPLPTDLATQMAIINDNWGTHTVAEIIDNENEAEAIADAGGWIGDWIDENHCVEEEEEPVQ